MEYNLTEVREKMKSKSITGVMIAQSVGKSAGWVNHCLRGNYPYNGAGKLPTDISDFLKSFNLIGNSELETGEDDDDFCEHGVIRRNCLICP